MSTKELLMGDRSNIPCLDEAAKPTQVSSHEYSANIHPEWSYGTAAHGGYLNTVIMKSVALHFHTTLKQFNQRDAISLHFEYLRPTSLEEVRINIRELRASKAVSTVNFSLQQNGKERVVGYATYMNREKARRNGPSVDTQYQLDPPIPPLDVDAIERLEDPHCVFATRPSLPGDPAKSIATIIFALPVNDSGDPSYNENWKRLKDPGSRWTPENLGLIFDWQGIPLENYFPDSKETKWQILERQQNWNRNGPPGKPWGWKSPRWYPTLSMSVDIKHGLPAEGEVWLFTRAKIRGMQEGRFDLTVEIWDLHGNLVAVVQQLVGVMDMKNSLSAKMAVDAKKKLDRKIAGSKL
ncbi:hypothetical protein KC343_g8067 [Hortaea werneckii]|nr:hypothetical protein KC352_g15942 [Hortaea werneckii]KAI7562398.1 hypothetical protein KC317_g8434 [Hortaea werneckii]KAI7612024.1 hypothetical protein KC346_g8026 [Hortaea werneckii]KAI7621329.1 hypothetical protein KC343_g8067 [Hortaea werneckii]KAI7662979.1 hypothetical protein KC319_g7915 [Hortaea werneckii]